MTDIEAIRARADAATPGPWKVKYRCFHDASDSDHDDDCEIEIASKDLGFSWYPIPNNLADGRFIAHARQDVPALLAEVDRLTAELNAANLRTVKAWDDELAANERVAALTAENEHLRDALAQGEEVFHDKIVEAAGEVAALSEENAQLRAIVDDLAAMKPIDPYKVACQFCGVMGPNDDPRLDEPHLPSCLWRRAVDLDPGVA